MGLTQPVLLFFEACVLGFFLGVLYDVFRILRLAFAHPAPLVFVEDVAYFFLVTVLSFSFVLLQSSGVLRAFLLLGELLGAILYFFSLSLLILKASSLIIHIVKVLLRVLFGITLLPVWRFLRWIGRGLRRLTRAAGHRILICRVKRRKQHPRSMPQKSPQKRKKIFSLQHKKHLKPMGEVVYNDKAQ